jgi:tRNA(fMet)-specific endonuclease VapC
MLDTDSVSYAIRGVGNVGERIVERKPSDLCISAITLAELRFGVERRKSRKLEHAVGAFLSDIAVVAFDDVCAVTFGRIAAKLAEAGARIGEADTLIAAHALTLGLTLVTNNERHFRRVAGLKIATWL